MSHQDITLVFLALGVLLASGRLLGELAQRLGQPAVVGELLAGVILGRTVMGRFWPDFALTLFPESGDRAGFLHGLTTVSAALFLLAAGIEVQLSTLLSIKTGGCPEDCAYCPQSVRFKTGVAEEELLPLETVLTAAREAKANGATRSCGVGRLFIFSGSRCNSIRPCATSCRSTRCWR